MEKKMTKIKLVKAIAANAQANCSQDYLAKVARKRTAGELSIIYDWANKYNTPKDRLFAYRLITRGIYE